MWNTVGKLSFYAVYMSIAIALLPCHDVQASDFESADEIDAVFAEYDSPDSPGCSLAIIKNGEIVYSHGYGKANLEHSLPITSESVFYFGSESKQFVTFSLLLLEEQGKLSLDDNIRKYVPEIPDYGAAITIRHLCHHTSGLRDYFILWDLAGIDYANYHSESEVIDLLSRQKELNFMPGEERLYCNSGYLLLSTIIRRASGTSLPDFAAKHIFEPLGMKNSHFHDDPNQLIPHRADGHMRADNGGWELLTFRFALVGSGGLYTNVEDLLHWDRNFYDNRLGKSGRTIIDRMSTRGRLNNGKKFDYGLALALGEYRGLNTIRHGGALGGYRSHMLRFPDENFTVITLFNLGNVNPAVYAEQVADICLKGKLSARPEPEGTSATGSHDEKRKKSVAIHSEKLADYTGDYYSDELLTTFTFVIDDGKLVHRNGARSVALYDFAGDDSFISAGKTLRFERDTGGAIVGFRLDAGRVKNLRFERQ